MKYTKHVLARKSSFLIPLFLLLVSLSTDAQEKLFTGKITNAVDVEGIHILNQSSRFNSITDGEGAFEIRAKASDTLLISSIAYMPQLHVVTSEQYDKGFISITLEALVNELDEVRLGARLSGNLALDIKNIKVVDTINFDDVGIPGFKGEPEEKIVPIVPGVGLLTAMDVEALYKHLSGYYRKLRLKRKWESENVAVAQMINYYTLPFFEDAYEIPKERVYDFLLFCMETTQMKQNFEAENYELVLVNLENQSSKYVARLNEK